MAKTKDQEELPEDLAAEIEELNRLFYLATQEEKLVSLPEFESGYPRDTTNFKFVRDTS